MKIQTMTGLRILAASLVMYTVSGFIKGSQGASTNNQLQINKPVNTSTWFYSGQHEREARSISQNCHTWSSWIDENHPNISNKNDKETITKLMRDEFCPSYGNTDKVQCKDNNGEPFQGDRMSANTEIICGRDEVSCTVKNINFKSCPDLAISFYCSCTGTRTPATKHSTLRTSTVATMSTKEERSSPVPTTVANIVTKQSTQHHQDSAQLYASGKPSSKSTTNLESVTQSELNTGHDVVDSNGQDTSNLNIGGVQVPWWIVILVASVIMFMLNLILTLCIYNKMRHRLQSARNNKNKRIHPLGDI